MAIGKPGVKTVEPSRVLVESCFDDFNGTPMVKVKPEGASFTAGINVSRRKMGYLFTLNRAGESNLGEVFGHCYGKADAEDAPKMRAAACKFVEELAEWHADTFGCPPTTTPVSEAEAETEAPEAGPIDLHDILDSMEYGGLDEDDLLGQYEVWDTVVVRYLKMRGKKLGDNSDLLKGAAPSHYALKNRTETVSV